MLDPAVETTSGLLHVSYVFCPNLLTADQGLIDLTIGRLSDTAMREIDRCLRATLELP